MSSLPIFRFRGGPPGRAPLLQQPGGRRIQVVPEETPRLPLQEGHGDLQLQLLQQDPIRQDEQSGAVLIAGSLQGGLEAYFFFPSPSLSIPAPGRLPGGVPVRAQHPRHEGDAHHTRDASQPVRAVRARAGLQRPVLPGLPGKLGRGRDTDLRRNEPGK